MASRHPAAFKNEPKIILLGQKALRPWLRQVWLDDARQRQRRIRRSGASAETANLTAALSLNLAFENGPYERQQPYVETTAVGPL
jgi:hypothetical protein